MPVILEDVAEVAVAADGVAMTAEIADGTAISISETDAMGLIETREAVNAKGTGIDGIERAIGDAHARLVEGAHHHSEISATEILH